MINDIDSLKQSAHGDLTNRARGGIVIYLLAWLVIMLPNQVHRDFPVFFLLNTAILLLVMLSRLAHYFVIRRDSPIPVDRWIPMIDDHLHGHCTAPDARRAPRIVRPRR